MDVNTGDTRDVSKIPGLGRSPGEGNGNLLQYSCLGKSMDFPDVTRLGEAFPVAVPDVARLGEAFPVATQTHVHSADDAIQPFHPLSSPSPPAYNLS